MIAETLTEDEQLRAATRMAHYASVLGVKPKSYPNLSEEARKSPRSGVKLQNWRAFERRAREIQISEPTPSSSTSASKALAQPTPISSAPVRPLIRFVANLIKHSMSTNYDSRVVQTRKLFIIRLYL